MALFNLARVFLVKQVVIEADFGRNRLGSRDPVDRAFPFPTVGCRAAVRKMGFRPQRTAMVGDQLFADVMAGRLAGLRSILVRPIHPEEEPWFTRLKRRPERLLLRWMGY